VAVQVAGGLASGDLLQHLREPRRWIQHILGGDAVHGLGHTVARAIVREACCQGTAHHLGEPVGVVVGVGAQAVIQEIAVVVPVVGLAVDAGQSVGIVVLIVYHVHVRCQALAVADGVACPERSRRVGVVVVSPVEAAVGARRRVQRFPRRASNSEC
jgi:hypothetical protein